MRLKVIEPLNTLFKDEVRRIGSSMGIDKSLARHPFPGPGLAIRILEMLPKRKLDFYKKLMTYLFLL